MSHTGAIILAAGRGSRMGDLTSDRPKALVSLAGRTLLDWQIAALTAAGVREITVVGGFNAEQLRSVWPNVVNYPKWNVTNMVGTLCHVAELLHESSVVVSYADIVYHPDHVRALLHVPDPIVMTYDDLWHELWTLRFENPLEDAESFTVSDGVIRTIGARAHAIDSVQGQFMGLIKFSPCGWRKVVRLLRTMSSEAIALLDMTGLFRRLLATGVSLTGVPVRGRWCEIDSAHDAALYARRLEDGDWNHDWRW
jgi:L-glutamine-phosphate cytidylyltransferase